jgi:hypothetical protein
LSEGDSVSAPGYELAIELFAAAERPLAKLRSAEAKEYLVNLSRQISDVVSRDKSPQNGRNADRERKAQPNRNARLEALIRGVRLADWDAADKAALEVIAATDGNGRNELFDVLLEYQTVPMKTLCSGTHSRPSNAVRNLHPG